MKTERELFEDWCHINDEFCTHRYTDNCQEYSDDYTQSAWLAWQARVPEGYVVVPKEPSADLVNHGHQVFLGHFNEGGQTGGRSLYFAYKAMIEAVEK